MTLHSNNMTEFVLALHVHGALLPSFKRVFYYFVTRWVAGEGGMLWIQQETRGFLTRQDLHEKYRVHHLVLVLAPACTHPRMDWRHGILIIL